MKKEAIRKPSESQPIQKILIDPIKTEFKNNDILQVIVGAAILSVPVGFTQETWDLGKTLPMTNILALIALALIFISLFVYTHYHRGRVKMDPKHHMTQFTKRVLVTYILSFIVVAMLLTLIQVAPWTTDAMLAFKRTAVVTFPSSLSATIVDLIK
tara:strand:+ start:1347 stop:1814 length:468 start_codon:yes stop_codon:yes gene_type:complete